MFETEGKAAETTATTPDTGNALDAKIAADEASRSHPDPDDPGKETTEEGADPSADPPTEPKAAEPAPEPDELQKRNARLFHEKREAQRQAKALQAQLDRLQGNAPPLSQDAETERLIEVRATELAAQAAYNSRANQIYEDGVKAYPGFEARLAGLRQLGGISPQVVEAADEAGDPAKIINYMADNLDEAERILALSPHKMGAAMGRIASKLSATPPPKAQSKAPAPIRPIGTTGNREVNEATMPLDEYMKREDARYGRIRR